MGKLLTADMLDSGLIPRLWHAMQPVAPGTACACEPARRNTTSRLDLPPWSSPVFEEVQAVSWWEILSSYRAECRTASWSASSCYSDTL